MKRIKLILLTVLTAFGNLRTYAYDFSATNEDGVKIYYNIVNNEAEVTNGEQYSGNIKIPSLVTYQDKTYQVTSIGDQAFKYSGLESIEIPNTIKYIGYYAFYACTNLSSIEIPNSVQSIGYYVFSNCSNLSTIKLSNSITSITPETFMNCGITSIDIPNSVISIEDEAFKGCSKLEHIYIPSSVTSIGSGAFYNCSKLTSLNVDEKNSIYSSVDGVLFNKNKSELILCPEGKTGKYAIPEFVTAILDGALYGCRQLTSIEIPSSVKSIGPTSFGNCQGLLSISVNKNNSEYSSEDGVLFNKAKSKLLVFPQGIKGGYIIPNTVTIIGKDAFNNCKGLTSIEIPNSVTDIEWNAFYACSNLTSIEIPKSVSSIKHYAFSNCTGLKKITIHNENPSTISIEGEIFYNVPKTCTLYVPFGCKDLYANAEVWNRFQNIVEITIGICSTPNITIADNKVTVTCDTKGAQIYTSIKSDDINNYQCTSGESITLTGQYLIESYAIASNMDKSEKATAILVWSKASDPSNNEKIEMGNERILLIHSKHGNIEVIGTIKNEHLSIFDTSGVLLFEGKTNETSTIIPITPIHGKIYIIRIADESIKYKF